LIAVRSGGKYIRDMKNSEPNPGFPGERLAKVMARAGVGSRREAEAWIAEGRVSVNGRTLTSAAVNVVPEDEILFDGKPLPVKEAARLWRYHKPPGLLVSHGDPQRRPTVFERLPPELPRVVSVGRLDLNSEGLLLLTNDGRLARRLELPETGWTRRYRVRVFGAPDAEALAGLARGITLDGVRYGPVMAQIDRIKGGNAWLTFALREGKNREVKRLCEHLGLRVNRLIRTSFGPFQLGDLPRGSVTEVPRRTLKEQLGRLMENETLAHRGG
jgi:23S rRNA pseudouridine2605 synthase